MLPKAQSSQARTVFSEGLAALALGGLTYLLFRPGGLGFGELTTSAPLAGLPIGGFALYSLPGGLWMYWATALQVSIWFDTDGISRRVWVLAPLLLGIGWETCQAAQALPGTFDVLDLAAYGAGWAFASDRYTLRAATP